MPQKQHGSWRGRLLAFMVAAVFGIVVLTFTSLFQGTAGDLALLSSPNDDWTLHLSSPQDLLEKKRARELVRQLMSNPAWQQVLGFADDRPHASQETSEETVDHFISRWADGEMFLAIRWQETEDTKNAPKARVFQSVTLVARPQSSRTLALARTLFFPVLGPILRNSAFNRDAGAEIVDGILNIANPAALGGNSRQISGLHGLSMTTVRDVIVLGTSFGEVKNKRDLIASLPTTPSLLPTNLVKLEMSRRGAKKIGVVFADLYGESSLGLVRALWNSPLPDRLSVNLEFSDVLKVGLVLEGTPWSPGPLRPRAKKESGLSLSLDTAEAIKRIGLGLIDNFDANDICREKQQLLAEEGRPLPELASWLTPKRLAALVKEVAALAGKNLTLTWSSPDKSCREDRPTLALHASLDHPEGLPQLAKELQVELGLATTWTAITMPPLAGFVGSQPVKSRLIANTIAIANGSMQDAPEVDSKQRLEEQTGLWHLRTSGQELAAMLTAIDAIRIREMAHPTRTRRRQAWLALGRTLSDPSLYERESADLFRRQEQAGIRALLLRQKAFEGLFRVFGVITGSAVVKNDQTHVVSLLE